MTNRLHDDKILSLVRGALLEIDDDDLSSSGTQARSVLDRVHARVQRPSSDDATEIAGIDSTGDAAIVKTVLRFPKFQFTDYLSLLKLDGAWIIVNKIYTVDQF